ncbi:MAG: AbrB/MazE/SpoVT family DNA-binding domain-containing protein [Verrucomicrobia bacterium]|nr:AbrB/MazE/SpoVT family DNA-binding domain-containing protein [Verrucomicrobiota bacterium]
MKTAVARWGNSLALRIPRDVAEKSRLTEGVEVELAAKADGFVVRRRAPSYELSALLAGVRPVNRHAEIATGAARGGEVW